MNYWSTLRFFKLILFKWPPWLHLPLKNFCHFSWSNDKTFQFYNLNTHRGLQFLFENIKGTTRWRFCWQILENEWINCHIFTSCNATEMLWVSKEAKNSYKARLFGLVRYFSPKPEKTLKNCQKMDAFASIFRFFKDFYPLVGK